MPSKPRITRLATFVYVPLLLVAIAWAWLQDGRLAWEDGGHALEAPFVVRLAASLGLGAALGVIVVSLTPLLVERARWARSLQRELSPIVSDLSGRQIAWLALTSSVSEEFFFRGAMQPALGLWLTSLIFGLVHTGPKRVFLVWGAWAALMGVLLGAIFAWTGVLWGCVVAHFWINDRNMRFMRRY